jgi:hypothetical protein
MPHIKNLYAEQDILMFKECYALEKIDGTNSFIKWSSVEGLRFGSGGTKHETFVKLFNEADLIARFTAMALPIDKQITIFGESYAGKEQGMSHTYGTVGKFIAFDVQINDCWLDVPKAEKVATDLGLEFVHYVKVSTDLKALDEQRDAPSVQAIRNGITTLGADGVLINPKKREGIVIRPLVELTKNNGSRVICKHKGDDFKETKTPRPVVDPAKIQVLADAQSVADEWVTFERLNHILQKIPDHGIEKMRDVIAAMLEDVLREGISEIVPSEAVNKAISKKTALMYKDYLKSQIGK